MDAGQVLPNLSHLASAGPGKLRQGSVSVPGQEGRGEARLSFTGLLCDLQTARIGRLPKAFRPGEGARSPSTSLLHTCPGLPSSAWPDTRGSKTT